MNIFKTINELGKKAKDASIKIRVLQKEKKMAAYQCLEKNIEKNAEQILSANKLDIENAFANDLSKPLINRLKVSEESIAGIIKSISEIKDQPDPIGTILENWEQPNGLKFSKISVPLGVLGVIYESRPNVTVDASCLALKSNNALSLRGGSDSYHTSKQLVNIITESFIEANLPENIIQMIPTTDREAVDHLLEMKDYVNVIIPRGGKSLIKKCLGFDMKVSVYDPFLDEKIINNLGGKKVSSIEEGLKIADFVSIHMPLNDKTKNLFNYELIKIMKKNSIIINTARGGIINEIDLDKALNENLIFGAGLDVFEKEPPNQDNLLLKNKKLIMSPHTSALTDECKVRMAKETVKNIIDFFENKLDKTVIVKL